MKLLFHNKNIEEREYILNLLIEQYIDFTVKLLVDLDSSLELYCYIYIFMAIDMFLEYISNNDYNKYYIEGYFLNCLKLIILLHDDDIDVEFTFEYICEKIYVNRKIMLEIQKEILEYYEYDFFSNDFIRKYIGCVDIKKCKKVAKYIKKKIYTSDFLLLEKEKKVQKIIRHVEKGYICFKKID